MKSSLKCILIMTAVVLFSSSNASGQQTEEVFEGQVSFAYKYLLYLPDGYENDKEGADMLVLAGIIGIPLIAIFLTPFLYRKK